MKKQFILALLLLVTINLSSCGIFDAIRGSQSGSVNDKTDSTEDNQDNVDDALPDEYVNDDITFDIGEKVYIVTAVGTDIPTFDIDILIGKAIGEPGASYITDDQTKKANELTIGVCNREASTVGYEKLRLVTRESTSVARYGIYSSGNSVAIVYDDVPGLERQIISCAIELFEQLYVSDNTSIKIDAGEFRSSTVELSVLYEMDETEKWNNFEAVAGADAAAAFKKMYSELYTDELIDWLASLYDSSYGGFYYSASARDNLQVTYNGSTYYLLPDVESTAMAISFIENSGMIYGYKSINQAIPRWLANQISKFVKEKQSADGYFYHPQWPTSITGISKRGLHLLSSTDLLSSLGTKPTYDTPSGIKGDGLLWYGAKAAAANAVLISSTSSFAHLEDRDAFIRYLNALNVSADSYFAGAELASQIYEIVERDKALKAAGAGYSLAQILIDYLDDNCYSATGHWESAESTSGINGLMEISSVYEALGKPLPYPEKAAQSAIAAIKKNDESGKSYDVYNAWGAICNIINNVENNLPSADAAVKVTEIREALIEDAAALIEATAEKLGNFMRDDGSFSFNEDGTSARSDMPLAQNGVVEGDVYSSIICSTKIVEYMFGAFGLPAAPMYSRADLQRFISLISENQTVYNYATTTSTKKSGAVNYRIYSYINSEGKNAPMIKIYDSANYTSEKLRRSILTHIITGEEGSKAGLSLDNLEFYMSYIFENRFTYYSASTESAIKDGAVNYRITTYTNKASVLKIYNSIGYTDEADMREILTHLIISEAGAKAKLSLADIDYYVKEWRAHNYLYDNPSSLAILGMSKEEVKARAIHVDLNTDDPYRSFYDVLGK